MATDPARITTPERTAEERDLDKKPIIYAKLGVETAVLDIHDGELMPEYSPASSTASAGSTTRSCSTSPRSSRRRPVRPSDTRLIGVSKPRAVSWKSGCRASRPARRSTGRR